MQSISVVIPTYRYDNYLNLRAAVLSLKDQKPAPEIIVVVGGDRKLYDKMRGLPVDVVLFDPNNWGACYARNQGADQATWDVVAFLDDDEIAGKDWCKNLLSVYEDKPDAGGVGGQNLPLWECEQPIHLPEEMFWLVGVTPPIFNSKNGDTVYPIRNTFAGNMSFRRDVFEKIGGFNTGIGLARGKLIQGEEPEICHRMREQTGLEYWYSSSACIYNRVPRIKTRMWYLLRRAYWQGYTKRLLALNGMPLSTEDLFLHKIWKGIVYRASHPSIKNWGQIAPLVLLTGATGIGYVGYRNG